MWPENANTFEFFLALGTQWRVSATGVVLGLDYAGVEAAARLRGVTLDSDMFHDLQAMELAALGALNGRSSS